MEKIFKQKKFKEENPFEDEQVTKEWINSVENKKTWESFYFDHEKSGKKVTGKVNVPINPMLKSIFYQHTQDEILSALESNDLEVETVEDFHSVNGVNIFFSVEGKKQ